MNDCYPPDPPEEDEPKRKCSTAIGHDAGMRQAGVCWNCGLGLSWVEWKTALRMLDTTLLPSSVVYSKCLAGDNEND